MAAERRAVQAEGMNHAGSDNARRSDPLLDLLARMVRTAHERERTWAHRRQYRLEGGRRIGYWACDMYDGAECQGHPRAAA